MSDWVLNRLFHTVVNCRDIDESVAFYKLLGFEVVHDRRDQVWPEFLGSVLSASSVPRDGPCWWRCRRTPAGRCST